MYYPLGLSHIALVIRINVPAPI